MEQRRIQFEVSEDEAKNIEAMMEACGTKTKKELLTNALTLLKWGIEEVASERIIVSMDAQNTRHKELVMPWMSNVKKKSAS